MLVFNMPYGLFQYQKSWHPFTVRKMHQPGYPAINHPCWMVTLREECYCANLLLEIQYILWTFENSNRTF